MKKNSFLFQSIKERIVEETKSLKPNDRLPSRTELVKRYGVTRTTIERAISELIGEGYLYSRDGSGTYVSEGNYNFNNSNIMNWGVILPNIMHDTYPGILRGVEDVANKNNINVVICNTDNDIDKQTKYIDKMIESRISGIIIVPAIRENIISDSFYKLREKSIPFIFCNRGVEGIIAPKVISNNFYGGYIATKHLLQKGYTKIAYISRPAYSISFERFQGYLAALGESGIESNEDDIIFEDTFDAKNPGYNSAIMQLKKTTPDAFFCFNDIIAQGVYYAVTDRGLTVGKEIGIVGYDNNTTICESLAVKLTSVKFKNYEIGEKAAELLLCIHNGEDIKASKTIILQPELIVRESSNRTII